MFVLTSENLTNLGGPMGTEYTYPNYLKYFNTAEAAKKYAEKEYADHWKGQLDSIWYKPIRWQTQGKKHYSVRTQDLGYVMYYVEEVQVES